jgi:hypothetical protein
MEEQANKKLYISLLCRGSLGLSCVTAAAAPPAPKGYAPTATITSFPLEDAMRRRTAAAQRLCQCLFFRLLPMLSWSSFIPFISDWPTRLWLPLVSLGSDDDDGIVPPPHGSSSRKTPPFGRTIIYSSWFVNGPCAATRCFYRGTRDCRNL